MTTAVRLQAGPFLYRDRSGMSREKKIGSKRKNAGEKPPAGWGWISLAMNAGTGVLWILWLAGCIWLAPRSSGSGIGIAGIVFLGLLSVFQILLFLFGIAAVFIDRREWRPAVAGSVFAGIMLLLEAVFWMLVAQG